MKTRTQWRSGASLLGAAAALWMGLVNPAPARAVEVEVDRLTFFQSTMGGSIFSPPVALGSKLVFGAVSNTLGLEPWAFDRATQALTNLGDLMPGLNSSYPDHMVVHDGAVLFESLTSPYVWRYDGASVQPVNTSAGPHTVRTFQNPVRYQGAVYSRTFTQTTGVELFRFASGAFELAADIQPNLPGMIDSQPHLLAVYRGELILTAWTATTGRKLYRYDGANLTLIDGYDWTYGPPEHAVVFGDQLVFSAARGLGGTEPWRYDGHTVEQIADLYPGFSPDPDEGPDEIYIHSSHPAEYVQFQGDLYFVAYNADRGRDLWRYDGATMEPALTLPADAEAWVSNLVVFDDALWFTTGQLDRRLWRFDGVDLSPAFDHSELLPILFGLPVALDGELFFTGVPEGQNGTELYRLTVVPLPGAAWAGLTMLGAMTMRRGRRG